MTGKLTAQAGKRDAVIEILLRASSVVAQLGGCRAYIVNEDVADATCVWVFEMWDNKDAHDASLKDERVRSLIAEAMPLMGGTPSGAELRVAGGHGINP
ncbi:MAG: antibiotic biosynthesis monooxygenase [Chloroflexi bacterium]|nr:antibiotic biosynthesis monooxygenase [Chloroflexota bacterium]